MRHNPSKND